MLIEFVKPEFTFENEAGCLNQLVHNGWKQINAIYSKPSSIRGGHYHKYNKELFFVIKGSFDLVCEKGDIKEEYHMKENDMFIILEDVCHSFVYHEDTYLVAMYDNGVELDENTKDIWK